MNVLSRISARTPMLNNVVFLCLVLVVSLFRPRSKILRRGSPSICSAGNKGVIVVIDVFIVVVPHCSVLYNGWSLRTIWVVVEKMNPDQYIRGGRTVYCFKGLRVFLSTSRIWHNKRTCQIRVTWWLWSIPRHPWKDLRFKGLWSVPRLEPSSGKVPNIKVRGSECEETCIPLTQPIRPKRLFERHSSSQQKRMGPK